jgi:hypothetical protein
MRPTLSPRLLFLLLLLGLPSAGCVWWPDHGHLHRGEIPASQVQAFIEGRTSRADVVLALGEPEWVSADERRLLYWVSEVHSWLFAYMVADAATMYFATDRYYLFEFDQQGLLQRRRCAEQSAEHGPSYAMWEPEQRVATLFAAEGAPR